MASMPLPSMAKNAVAFYSLGVVWAVTGMTPSSRPNLEGPFGPKQDSSPETAFSLPCPNML